MPLLHLSRPGAFLVGALASTLFTVPLRAQSAASTFTIFVRATPIGSEQVTVQKSAEGWTITGSGRIGPPIDLITRRVEVRYDTEWKPLELTIDATAQGVETSLHT